MQKECKQIVLRYSVKQVIHQVFVKDFAFPYKTDFFKICRLLFTSLPKYIPIFTIIKQSINLCSSLLCSCIVFMS